MLRKDKVIDDKIRGGGVALYEYIKNEFSMITRNDLTEENFPEGIWCNIEIRGEKTLVGVCYRPPSTKNKL